MRRSAPAWLAALALMAAGAEAQSHGVGIELRIFADARVLARRGAAEGGGGEAVRVIEHDGVCDGTLGPNVTRPVHDFVGDLVDATVADVRGCAPRDPLVAVVHPPPLARWPVSVPVAGDPELEAAVPIAEAAAARAGHLRGALAWSPARAYRVADVHCVLVSGPACTEQDATHGVCTQAVAALVRVPRGLPAEVVIARPAHWLWADEHLIDCRFEWIGVTDVDGDGVVELLEAQRGESAFVLRLVRVGARPEGDVVWIASHRGSPGAAQVGSAPRPVTAVR